MTEEQIVVYGAEWCIDCRRAKRFLTQNQIPFEWINIDRDKEGERLVLKINKGMRSIPTILFSDGSVLVEPSNAQLAKKLQILA
jgi:glutaredoxin-like protein